LGLQRTGGFETIAFCEIDPFCRKVLAKHWPGVPCFEDITKLDKEELNSLGRIDVICGGFPCQPVSCAGKRKGKEDARWLWPEFYRIVCEVKPEWVLVENVPGLLSADSGRLFAGILRDLSESGYDAEWNIVSAASVGAPHLRKRVFIVAKMVHPLCGGYIHQESSTSPLQDSDRQENRLSGEASPDVADADSILSKSIFGNMGRIKAVVEAEQGIPQPGSVGEAPGEITDTSRKGLPRPEQEWEHGRSAAQCDRWIFERRLGRASDGLFKGLDRPWGKGWEDGTPRIATGQKDRVNRLKALGNAICPQVAQFVGWCLLDSIRTEAAQ
jgi:DNA (cytosine-5)-methyltransferase 1